jgi:large repetitive protein
LAISGDRRATLRWTASGGSGSQIIGYVVMPYLGSYALTPRVITSARTTDVVSGLVNGLTYRFRIAVVTQSAMGPLSVLTNAVTIGVPTAPTAVTALGRAGKAEVRWKAPTTANGSRITAYLVTPYLNGVAQPARVVSPRATAAKIGGLTAGDSYRFRVAAKNLRGTGAQSGPSNAVMPALA